MTGRPAETWRRFKFASPPDWAYALLILICLGGLGVIAYAAVMLALAQRASGYLPLTRTASRTVVLATWIPAALLIGTVLLWILAAVVAASSSAAAASSAAFVIVVVSFLTLAGGLVGRYLVKPLLCPRAKVMEPAPGQTDRIVELRNVSPAFVSAVWQGQQARAARP